MATINGTAGDDSLLGTAGADWIDGLAGNDIVYASAGTDTVDGGDGTDTMVLDYSASGVAIRDLYIPGQDVDPRFAPVAINLGGAFGWQTIGHIEQLNVTLTPFADVATLSSTNDTMFGGYGNDWLDAAIGNDWLDGGAGNDNVYGSNGTDTVLGGVGNDTLGGGEGDDTLNGGEGYDRVRFGPNDGQGPGAALNMDFSAVDFSQPTVVVTDANGQTDTLLQIEAVRIVGSELGDSLVLSKGDDEAYGGGANDTIYGDAGNDRIYGGDGNDTLQGGDGNDNLQGGDGNDTLFGGAGVDTLVGGAGDDTMDGGIILDRNYYADYKLIDYRTSTSAINLNSATGVVQDGLGGTDQISNFVVFFASNFNDTITGGTAAIFEQFEGGAGDDTIDGGAITDTLNGTNVNRATYQTAAAAVNVNLSTGTATGGAGNDVLLNINHLRGSAFDDTLTGSDRTDISEDFAGRAGNDLIDGKGGVDIARYDSATSAINANLVTGTVIDGYGGTDTLLNIEGLHGSNFNDTLTGGNGANGTGSRDGYEYFLGGAGNDAIDGGGGYDFAAYRISNTAVNVTLGGTGAGTALDGYGTIDTLINIEGVGGSWFDDTLTGSDSGVFESFEGNRGNDQIDGKGGTDRADYTHSTSGVTVNLAAGTAQDGYGFTDTLANIEAVRGSRDFHDLITGNSGNNSLEGQGGNDTLIGGTGNDTLIGGSGADTLNGGPGADHMEGGFGGDVFIVDESGDVVVELAGQGNDRVSTALTCALPANVEALTLSGTANVDGAGNELANLLQGNPGHNRLSGLAGNDRLTGGAGNDTLDGGTGADFMVGQEGDDTYYIDASGDQTIESYPSFGIDHAISSVNRTISANVENLTLVGAAVLGSGNGLANVLSGNGLANALNGVGGNDTLIGGAGNDTLNGGLGADRMEGGAGNDVYAVDAAGDVVVELTGEGTDRVSSTVSWVLGGNIEDLTLAGTAAINGTGNTLSNVITGTPAANAIDGGAGDDTLSGNDGNDTLTGGTGNDRLTGGNGADRFHFVTTGEGTDTITDFASGSDKIVVVAANFGLVVGGTANLVVNGTASTSAAVFLYTSATGSLAFDADGNGPGAAVTLALLANKPGSIVPADMVLGP